jgi:hypothetical protein
LEYDISKAARCNGDNHSFTRHSLLAQNLESVLFGGCIAPETPLIAGAFTRLVDTKYRLKSTSVAPLWLYVPSGHVINSRHAFAHFIGQM